MLKDNDNSVWLCGSIFSFFFLLVLVVLPSNLWTCYLLKLDSNIEDISREAGSVNVDEDALHSKCTSYSLLFFSWSCVTNARMLYEELQMELGQLCGGDTLTYQPLYEMVQVIVLSLAYKSLLLDHQVQFFL